MAKFYMIRIKMGKMTLEQVPERWREEVRNLLDEEKESKNDETGNNI